MYGEAMYGEANEFQGDVIEGEDGSFLAVDSYGRSVRFRPRRDARRARRHGGACNCAPPRYRGDEGMGADDGSMMGRDDGDDESSDSAVLDNLISEEGDGEDLQGEFGIDTVKAEGDLAKLQSDATSLEKHIAKLENKRFVVRRAARVAKLQGKLGKIQAKIAGIKAQMRADAKAKAGQMAQADAAVQQIRRQSTAGPGVNASTRAARGGPAIIGQAQARQMLAAQAAQGVRWAPGRVPAGSGRLISVPMLLNSAASNRTKYVILADDTLETVGILQSEDVPYAVYRVVGFTSKISKTAGAASSSFYVSNLSVRGGANLFMHESAQDASEYETDLEHLQGLRDYPTVTSPNKVFLTLSAQGTADDVLTGAFNVVVDTISDDTFGSGVPGPYSG